MLELKSRYEFYHMTRKVKRAMLGCCFTEVGRSSGIHVYFPFELDKKQFNYGESFGLIGAYAPMPYYKNKSFKCFTIGAVSPDDLDIGVHFAGPPEKIEALHKKALSWLHSIPRKAVFYTSIIEGLIKELDKSLTEDIIVVKDY